MVVGGGRLSAYDDDMYLRCGAAVTVVVVAVVVVDVTTATTTHRWLPY